MLLLQHLARAEASSPLARLVEPWNGLYSDSKAVATAVMFFHLVPLLIAGGAALTADRATIRASRLSGDERTRQLSELARTHAIVLFDTHAANARVAGVPKAAAAVRPNGA